MSPQHLERIRSKMRERLITRARKRALAHARSHTRARCVTCGHVQYVPIKFEENASKDN
jgi:hypothetical protein